MKIEIDSKKYKIEKTQDDGVIRIVAIPKKRNCKYCTKQFESMNQGKLYWKEPSGGSCCGAGLGLVWHCYCIFFTFVCLIQKKNIYFELLRGQGCVESKNMTSAKRKSTMSSLNPSIIQVDSFKCRADVPLMRCVRLAHL